MADQINQQIKKVSLPLSWADKMIEELEKDKEQEAKDGSVFAQKQKILNQKIEISEKDWLEPNFAGTGIGF